MNIAVASGKGGTGKTTVAVGLALSAERPVRLLDCDVEEPNDHLFLAVALWACETVGISVPVVDDRACTGCGECARACQYNAIALLKDRPVVFPELCHGCGGCAKVCPAGAIREVSRDIGLVEKGRRDGLELVCGRLDVGHPMSPPVIRAVKRHAAQDAANVVDCPPGTSCPAVAALRGCDFALLVAEPTPFGLHDLEIAAAVVRRMGIPLGVLVNRSDMGDSRVSAYCRREAVPVLLEIPEDRRIAEAGSRGEPAVEALPEYRRTFERLWTSIHACLAAPSAPACEERKGIGP